MRRILTIDGGGLKGLFPATILAELERESAQPLHRYFDLIVGTSTGGIVALALAASIPAATIADLYERTGASIFPQATAWDRAKNFARSFFKPRYASDTLAHELAGALGSTRLGNARTRLVIPATTTETAEPHLFKTRHADWLCHDHKLPMRDVALATAAAPTYLPAHRLSNGLSAVDGGLWANNPVAIAVTEAIGVLGWNREELRVLSIGCTSPTPSLAQATGTLALALKFDSYFLATQSMAGIQDPDGPRRQAGRRPLHQD